MFLWNLSAKSDALSLLLGSASLLLCLIGFIRYFRLGVAVEHHLVDSFAMRIVTQPAEWDVVVTDNMFGDILSDEASILARSLGMLLSASLNDQKFGVYEPIHGSAPDIAGQVLANPIATILSAAMMLRHSLGLDTEVTTIEKAVEQTLAQGARTADISKNYISTSEMTAIICANL